MPRRADPYDLIACADKTTLACPGGIALGFGPGPGLRHAIFWNRIGSLFSCYRPAVALLTLFDPADPHEPVALATKQTSWEPNLATATYAARGLAIKEQRSAVKAGLRCLFELTSTSKQTREWVLFFHGQVQQWEFFDYGRSLPEQRIACELDLKQRMLTLTQPHPHHGLPEVNSIQTIEVNRELESFGFGLSVSDLQTLWQEHGCLKSLRLRLGQVGGRFTADTSEPVRFSHRHPLYYFAIRVRLRPGQTQLINIGTQYCTDDADGGFEDAYNGTTPAQWRRYLSDEVPQLDCDDEALKRYWYYVWYVLRANRTAPGRHITFPFTAPSKYLYWGPWIWDGYFHVLGEVWLKDPAVAKDSIRAVLQMQFPNGFLPVCSGSQYRMCFHEEVQGYTCPGGGGYASYVPPAVQRYRELSHPFEAALSYKQPGKAKQARLRVNEKTQTPLITVAAALYCWLRDDPGFAREVLPPLLAYDDWLWRRRTDQKGRFILWHGDESGWDNATRHYPVPAKPFDVQVHTLMHRLGLKLLLDKAYGKQDKASKQARTIEQRLKATREALRTYWDPGDQWYYDFGARGDGQRTDRRRKQIAASGLFALLADQSERTVSACLFALSHERVFRAPYPLPTLARCDPDYAPHGWGWNGPVWLQVNYFTITGFIEAGQYDAAFKLWDKTKQLIIRDGQPHAFELYDPETGSGMGCPDYSWQAMINHLIIRYFAGVRGEVLMPALPPGLNRLAVSNLPGAVRAVNIARRGKQVRLRVEYDKPQTCKLAPAGLGKVLAVISDSVSFVEREPGLWDSAPDAKQTWEVQIKCR